MEKMRPLDGKLKYQIDHLLTLAHPASEEHSTTQPGEHSNSSNSLLKPNLSDLMSDDDDEPSDDERGRGSVYGSLGKKNGQERSTGVYVPPRLQAVPYNVRIKCFEYRFI